MNKTNYLKIFSIVAFLAFAGFSCWATAESLHLLLFNLPLVLCWIVTIGFFVIASLGSKMIVDSLNQDIYMEHRRWNLFLGIIIMIIFWLLCSMPTNTHTFFYRNVINDKVTNDISTTKGYLAQVRDDTQKDSKIQKACTDLEKNVNIKLGELEAEIKNESNPGDGPQSQNIRREIAKLLGVAKIDALTYRGTSVQDRIKLCDSYRAKILTLTKSREDNIKLAMESASKNNKNIASTDYKNLEMVEKSIKDKTLDINDPEDVNIICDQLNKAYNTIGENKDFVSFKDAEDKAIYTAPNPVTKVKRMLSVFDVWTDYLHGDYAGQGFLFWIMISILVDVAAFVFFDIAFKKQD